MLPCACRLGPATFRVQNTAEATKRRQGRECQPRPPAPLQSVTAALASASEARLVATAASIISPNRLPCVHSAHSTPAQDGVKRHGSQTRALLFSGCLTHLQILPAACRQRRPGPHRKTRPALHHGGKHGRRGCNTACKSSVPGEPVFTHLQQATVGAQRVAVAISLRSIQCRGRRQIEGQLPTCPQDARHGRYFWQALGKHNHRKQPQTQLEE